MSTPLNFLFNPPPYSYFSPRLQLLVDELVDSDADKEIVQVISPTTGTRDLAWFFDATLCACAGLRDTAGIDSFDDSAKSKVYILSLVSWVSSILWL